MFISDPDFIPVRDPKGVIQRDPVTGLALFKLSEALRYVGTDGREIIVPSGDESDLGSISNRFLGAILSPHEFNFVRAFRIHDHLYNGATDRLDADLRFHAAMREEGCDTLRSLAAFLAVRIFGHSHYKKINP